MSPLENPTTNLLNQPMKGILEKRPIIISEEYSFLKPASRQFQRQNNNC